MSKHTDLIDKVNEAKTEIEHIQALAYLRGWRQGREDSGVSLSCTEADFHTMEKYETEDICYGVLINWKPA